MEDNQGLGAAFTDYLYRSLHKEDAEAGHDHLEPGEQEEDVEVGYDVPLRSDNRPAFDSSYQYQDPNENPPTPSVMSRGESLRRGSDPGLQISAGPPSHHGGLVRAGPHRASHLSSYSAREAEENRQLAEFEQWEQQAAAEDPSGSRPGSRQSSVRGHHGQALYAVSTLSPPKPGRGLRRGGSTRMSSYSAREERERRELAEYEEWERQATYDTTYVTEVSPADDEVVFNQGYLYEDNGLASTQEPEYEAVQYETISEATRSPHRNGVLGPAPPLPAPPLPALPAPAPYAVLQPAPINYANVVQMRGSRVPRVGEAPEEGNVVPPEPVGSPPTTLPQPVYAAVLPRPRGGAGQVPTPSSEWLRANSTA